MEIPVINRLTDLEASFSSLNHNPSLISRLIPTTFDLGFVNLSFPLQFCKWGALFLALAYTLSTFAYRIKILILHLNTKSKSLSEPLLSYISDDFSTDDETDDISDDSDDEEDEEEEEPTKSSYEDLTRFDRDFRVKGHYGNFSGKLRRRSTVENNFPSLSEFVSGNGVVKLWESAIPSVSISPSVIFTGGEDGRFGLGLWDFRMKLESPAVQAEWRSDRMGRPVGIDAGRIGKVYVSDDVSMGFSVGDLRKVDTPLEYLTALF